MFPELSGSQLQLRDTAREFADKILIPNADHHDQREEFPRENIDKLAELGFLGLVAPESFGGLEQNYVTLCVVLEELNRGCASTGITVSVHNSLFTGPLLAFGNEEQHERWLPRVTNGEVLGAYAITEPDHGSDAASIETTCRKDGDGYILNGTKAWITNGSEAGLFITFATLESSLGSKGICAFIIESDMPGFSVGKKEKKLGIRASDTVQLLFEDLEVPASNLLGEEGQGFKIAMHTLDGGRIGIASQGVGIAQACLDASLEFAGEREMFGRLLQDNQLVSHRIAEVATEIDAARLLMLRAASLKDAGMPYGMEAAMAKLFASETANRAAHHAIEILGGIGVSHGHKVERLFRDAKITEIYEGTSEIQRLVISRHFRT